MRHVLLIDRDGEGVRLVSRALRGAGIFVSVVEDAISARAILAALNPDLLLVNSSVIGDVGAELFRYADERGIAACVIGPKKLSAAEGLGGASQLVRQVEALIPPA